MQEEYEMQRSWTEDQDSEPLSPQAPHQSLICDVGAGIMLRGPIPTAVLCCLQYRVHIHSH